MVVTCLPGLGPGEFYYEMGSGAWIAPRCFAVDKAGNIYIGEVYFGIRLHKFDPEGKLIVMLGLEGSVSDVFDMAVGPSHEVYMHTGYGRAHQNVVNRYCSRGELTYQLGTKGILAPEMAAREPLNGEGKHRLFPVITEMAVVANGDLFVEAARLDGRGGVYRFDKAGKLLETADRLPRGILEKARDKRAKEIALRGPEWKPGSPSPSYCLIAPDGHFYYMVYDAEKLEIHRVTFPDAAASEAPDASSMER